MIFGSSVGGGLFETTKCLVQIFFTSSWHASSFAASASAVLIVTSSTAYWVSSHWWIISYLSSLYQAHASAALRTFHARTRIALACSSVHIADVRSALSSEGSTLLKVNKWKSTDQVSFGIIEWLKGVNGWLRISMFLKDFEKEGRGLARQQVLLLKSCN